MPTPDERLQALLGGAPPASVTALDESSRATLADLIEAARRHQSASLEKAFTETVKHVPFPVRAVVKKVLLG